MRSWIIMPARAETVLLVLQMVTMTLNVLVIKR